MTEMIENTEEMDWFEKLLSEPFPRKDVPKT